MVNNNDYAIMIIIIEIVLHTIQPPIIIQRLHLQSRNNIPWDNGPGNRNRHHCGANLHHSRLHEEEWKKQERKQQGRVDAECHFWRWKTYTWAKVVEDCLWRILCVWKDQGSVGIDQRRNGCNWAETVGEAVPADERESDQHGVFCINFDPYIRSSTMYLFVVRIWISGSVPRLIGRTWSPSSSSSISWNWLPRRQERPSETFMVRPIFRISFIFPQLVSNSFCDHTTDLVTRGSAAVGKATRADNVRFHDDKSLYTGVHSKVCDPIVPPFVISEWLIHFPIACEGRPGLLWYQWPGQFWGYDGQVCVRMVHPFTIISNCWFLFQFGCVCLIVSRSEADIRGRKIDWLCL